MKLRHLAVLLGVMVALTGCGSKEAAAPAPEATTEAPAKEEVKEEAGATTEGFTGTQTRESLYELGKGDVIVTEMTFENGAPVDLKIDVRTETGEMKSELSKSGEYVMSKDGTPWDQQIVAVVDFLKENNFDTSKVTYTTDAGNTDAVSGVSIKVPDFLAAVEEALK